MRSCRGESPAGPVPRPPAPPAPPLTLCACPPAVSPMTTAVGRRWGPWNPSRSTHAAAASSSSGTAGGWWSCGSRALVLSSISSWGTRYRGWPGAGGAVALCVCPCLNAEPPRVPPQQLESLAWEQSGKSIVSSHSDGGYMVWAVSGAGQRTQQPAMSTIPYGTGGGLGGLWGWELILLHPSAAITVSVSLFQGHSLAKPSAKSSGAPASQGRWVGWTWAQGTLGGPGSDGSCLSHPGTPSSSSVGGCHGPAMVTGTVSACCRARPWPRSTSPPVSLTSSPCRVQRCPREVCPARATLGSG